MCALKSYRYVKIMITDNVLVFLRVIFRIYSVLSSKFAYCVELDCHQQWQSYGCLSMTTLRVSHNEKCLHRNPTIM